MESKFYNPLTQAIQLLQPWIGKADESGAISATIVEERVCLASSKGDVRDKNQDRLIFALIENQLSSGSDLAVAVLSDGMGGMEYGGQAASLATSSFLSYIATGRDAGLRSLTSKAINYSDERVYELLDGKGGTTLSAILYGSKGCVGVNVGDSRIYHFDKNKEIKQLTTDDTIEGQINHESERADSWLKPFQGDSRLAQFIGMGGGLEPRILDLSEYFQEGSESGYLITSDGAHYLGNPMLQKITRKSDNMEKIPYRIVMTSEWLGGHDNSSAILVPSKITFISRDKNEGEITIKVATISREFAIAFPNYNATMNKMHGLSDNQNLLEERGPKDHNDRHVMNQQARLIGEAKEEASEKEIARQEERGGNEKKAKTGKKKKAKKKKEEINLKLDFISMETDSNDEDSEKI